MFAHIYKHTHKHNFTPSYVHTREATENAFIEFQSTDYYTLEALYVTVYNNNNNKKKFKTNKYRAMSIMSFSVSFLLLFPVVVVVFVYLFTFFSCMYFGYCLFLVSFIWLKMKQLLLLLSFVFFLQRKCFVCSQMCLIKTELSDTNFVSSRFKNNITKNREIIQLFEVY